MQEPSHFEYLVISGIIPIFGLPGNILLLGFSLRRWKNYHLTVNEILISLLTLFNLFKIGLFLVVSYAAYYQGSWTFGNLSCKIVSKSGAVAYLMSEFIIVFLVNIHYKVISRNQFYTNDSRKVAICACMVVFVISSGLMAIPKFYDWTVTSYKTAQNLTKIDVCQVKMEIWLISILFVLLLPAVYCIIVIFMLKHKMKQSLAQLRNNMKSGYFQKRSNENRSIFTILAIMSFGFSIAHVPLMILHTIEYFAFEDHQAKLDHWYSWYTFALFLLSALDTCTTPIAYLIFNRSLRRFLRRICCCKKQRFVFKRRKAVKLVADSKNSATSSSFTLKSF